MRKEAIHFSLRVDQCHTFEFKVVIDNDKRSESMRKEEENITKGKGLIKVQNHS